MALMVDQLIGGVLGIVLGLVILTVWNHIEWKRWG